MKTVSIDTIAHEYASEIRRLRSIDAPVSNALLEARVVLSTLAAFIEGHDSITVLAGSMGIDDLTTLISNAKAGR